jgi:hypothetical protein
MFRTKLGCYFDLIIPKQQQGNTQENPTEKPEEQKNETNKENIEKKLEEDVKSLLIDDVVNDNRIKFFREPRLGCYLALDLTYKTSLSYNSLLSAIQCTKNYETAKKEQEERKKEWSEKQEEIKNQINELKETKKKEEEARKIAEENEAKAKLAAANATENDPNKPPEEKKEGTAQPTPQVTNFSNKRDNTQEVQDNIDNLEKQLTPWEEEPVKLQDYEKEDKNIYICLDTLGQDRIFSDEEIKYIKKVGGNIRKSLEDLEQSLLEKDRDIRIKFLDEETKIKTEEKYSDEKFEECLNNRISQYYFSDEYKSKWITDENAKTFEGDLEKMRYREKLIIEGESINILLTFQDF